MEINTNKNDLKYSLSVSYGKDSLACLGAIEELGWPLDRIVHAEVWATDTIPADLPPMVEFKKKADEIIKQRWGITVEHVDAGTNFDKMFHREYKKSVKGRNGKIFGWPILVGPWCNSKLKMEALRRAKVFTKGYISYVGIAVDEPERLERLRSGKEISPLAELNWTEAMCLEWCKKNDLLSPIYENKSRGGCWFCINQGVNDLRSLRKDYPEYWALMLKWDTESPQTFKTDGITIHDYEKRFQLEDEGFVYPDDKIFRWDMLDQELNYRLF